MSESPFETLAQPILAILPDLGLRAADIVLSYGRRGVTTLPTWGAGPQTAASIPAKMQMQDEEFYADLLKVKLKYIQTRLWD